MQRGLFIGHDKIENGLFHAQTVEVHVLRGEQGNQRALRVKPLHGRVIADLHVGEGDLGAAGSYHDIGAGSGVFGVLVEQIEHARVTDAVILREVLRQVAQRGQIDKLVREKLLLLHHHQGQSLQHGYGGVFPELAVAAAALLALHHGACEVVDDAYGLLRVAGLVVLAGQHEGIPAVALGRLAEVDDIDAIAAVLKGLGGGVIQLALGVGDQHALAGTADDLQHGHGKQAALFAAGGADDQAVGIGIIYIHRVTVADGDQPALHRTGRVGEANGPRHLHDLLVPSPARAAQERFVCVIFISVIFPHGQSSPSPPKPTMRLRWLLLNWL